MEKQIKEAIEIIENVRKSMPECTNKAFLKGALNELDEALSKAKVFSSNAVLADSSPIDNTNWKEKYETAVKQKINYSKEVDRLREKYEPKGFTNEYKGA